MKILGIIVAMTGVLLLFSSRVIRRSVMRVVRQTTYQGEKRRERIESENEFAVLLEKYMHLLWWVGILFGIAGMGLVIIDWR